MITQIVSYRPNPNNPESARRIIEKARELLGAIPGTTFTIGRALRSERPDVNSNNAVIKMTSWNNREDMEWYFRHNFLRAWCEFVLHGWMIRNSTAADPQTEFIDHILNCGPKLERVRNPAIPEKEVVWAGEEIQIFTPTSGKIFLPSDEYIYQKLEPVGVGTNANWKSGFCEKFTGCKGHETTLMFFSGKLLRFLEEYLDGVPKDLRITVFQKIPAIVKVFVDDEGEQEKVIKMVSNEFSL